jgi:uroporphyrin-III C-methyltransferase
VAGNAADPDTTLVVYMGLSTLSSLAPKLMKHGLPPNTPAVAVERGTTPQQRMVLTQRCLTIKLCLTLLLRC